MTHTSITPPATIGFIGLGNMGKPMAKLLVAAGYKLCVGDLNADAVKTFCSEHKFPTFVLPRKFTSGFYLGLMAKDLRFAKALVDSVQSSNVFVDAISKLYDDAEAKLGPMADNTEIHRYLEQLAANE